VLAGLGSSNLQDATLTGASTLTAGRTNETGRFSAQTAVNGFHQLQLDLPTASRTDVQSFPTGIAQGYWLDTQGVQHAVPEHNLIVGHSWFFPSIALARLLQSSHSAFSLVGTETKDGILVEHFTITNGVLADGSLPGPKQAHLEQLDLYLDSQTLRPAILSFNLHPDSNALIDIPVEVRYSAYIQTGGVWLPSHVQRYINSTLNLNLTVQTAQFNTGFPQSLAK
jgi:hypothetical protein